MAWQSLTLQRYYEKNRENRNAASRAYHAANVERRREQHRVWYLLHSAERRSLRRAYAAANRPAERTRFAEWRRLNPERARAYGVARRVLRLGNGGSHSLEEWLEKCDLFARCCAYCGERIKLEQDHRIPLTRGGSDNIDNIVPACRPCNVRKGTKTDAEFIASRKERLN